MELGAIFHHYVTVIIIRLTFNLMTMINSFVNSFLNYQLSHVESLKQKMTRQLLKQAVFQSVVKLLTHAIMAMNLLVMILEVVYLMVNGVVTYLIVDVSESLSLLSF